MKSQKASQRLGCRGSRLPYRRSSGTGESPQGLPGCRFAPTHSPALKTHFLSLAPLVENCLGETLPHAKLWAQSESGSHRHGESDLSCQGSAQDVASLPFAVAADTTLLLRPRLVGWGRPPLSSFQPGFREMTVSAEAQNTCFHPSYSLSGASSSLSLKWRRTLSGWCPFFVKVKGLKSL